MFFLQVNMGSGFLLQSLLNGKNVTFELRAISTGGFPGDWFRATFKQMMFRVRSSSFDYNIGEDFFSLAMDRSIPLINQELLFAILCIKKSSQLTPRPFFYWIFRV